jgi:uncharacterized caspase-like protein
MRNLKAEASSLLDSLLMWFLFASLVLGSPSAEGQYFKNSYAVVIGVNKAPSSNWPLLTYPEKDAKAVGDLLASQGFKVIRLYGPDAKKFNIVSTLTNLARKLTSDDRVLVYFAGHGDTEMFGGQSYGYIVPYDGGKDPAAYISMEEIKELST